MKKIFLALSTAMVLLAACNDNTANQELKNKLEQATAALKNAETQQEILKNNKEVVVNFYQEFFGNKDLSAADKYIGDVYIQHNPMVADGKDALVQAAKEWFAGSSEKENINIINVAAENDLVFVQIADKFPNGDKSMVIDVFRVTDGKITEHWDAFAEFKKGDKSANDNPLF